MRLEGKLERLCGSLARGAWRSSRFSLQRTKQPFFLVLQKRCCPRTVFKRDATRSAMRMCCCEAELGTGIACFRWLDWTTTMGCIVPHCRARGVEKIAQELDAMGSLSGEFGNLCGLPGDGGARQRCRAAFHGSRRTQASAGRHFVDSGDRDSYRSVVSRCASACMGPS